MKTCQLDLSFFMRQDTDVTMYIYNKTIWGAHIPSKWLSTNKALHHQIPAETTKHCDKKYSLQTLAFVCHLFRQAFGCMFLKKICEDQEIPEESWLKQVGFHKLWIIPWPPVMHNASAEDPTRIILHQCVINRMAKFDCNTMRDKITPVVKSS